MIRIGSIAVLSLTTMALAAGCADDEAPAVTYWEDVYPLMTEKCLGCHTADGIGSQDFTDPANVKTWGHVIAQKVTAREMPPWGITDDGSCQTFQESMWLEQSDIDLINEWVELGMPEGDQANAPVLQAATVGRDIDPTAATTVRASTPEFAPVAWGTPLGVNDEYVCFDSTLELGGKFLTAYQGVPGNPAITHHMVFMLVDAAAASSIEGKTNADQLAELDAQTPDRAGWPCFGAAGDGVTYHSIPGGWVPGQHGNFLPEGAGFRVGATDRIIVQMHYNMADPSTIGMTDSSEMRFSIADSIEREAFISLPDAFLYTILNPEPASLPPGEEKTSYSWDMPMAEVLAGATGGTVSFGDAMPYIDLFAVLPHMHARGVSQKTTVTQGDGSEVCLSNVFDWDFHWQRVYNYEGDPIRLDANSTLHLTCDWDTRGATEPVTPGWGTQNEMCLNGLYFMLPAQAAQP